MIKNFIRFATNIIFASIFLKIATSTQNTLLRAFWPFILESFIKLGLQQIVKEDMYCGQKLLSRVLDQSKIAVLLQKQSQNAKNEKCIARYFVSLFSHFAPGSALVRKVKGFCGLFFRGMNETQNLYEM